MLDFFWHNLVGPLVLLTVFWVLIVSFKTMLSLVGGSWFEWLEKEAKSSRMNFWGILSFVFWWIMWNLKRQNISSWEVVESLKLPFDEPTTNFTFVVAVIPIIGMCTVSLMFVIGDYYEKVSKKLGEWFPSWVGLVFFYLTSFIIGLIVWLSLMPEFFNRI